MLYILPIPNESGAYPAPQSAPAPGLLAFPDEFLPVFYPEGKEAAGFVTIQHDGAVVTNCQWDEAAYQAYLAALPEPEPGPEPEPSQLDRIEAQATYTAMMTDTLLEV